MSVELEEALLRAERYRAVAYALRKEDARRSIVEMGVSKKCVVYFVRESGIGAIKIGVTGNLKSRLDMLRSNSPHEIEALAHVPGDERLESYLHDLFRASQIRGEWFRDSPELFACIEELKEGRLALSESERLLVEEAVETYAQPFAVRPNRKRTRRYNRAASEPVGLGLLDGVPTAFKARGDNRP